MLTARYKETLMILAGDLITVANQDVAFVNNIITGDKLGFV
jgi:hypothetical protein